MSFGIESQTRPDDNDAEGSEGTLSMADGDETQADTFGEALEDTAKRLMFDLPPIDIVASASFDAPSASLCEEPLAAPDAAFVASFLEPWPEPPGQGTATPSPGYDDEPIAEATCFNTPLPNTAPADDLK